MAVCNGMLACSRRGGGGGWEGINTTHAMNRSIILILAYFLGVSAGAQTAQTHHFLATAPIDPFSQKMAHVAMLEMDAHAILSFQNDELKVKASVPLTDIALLDALNGSGSHVVYRTGQGPDRTVTSADARPPARVHTEDPAGDELRYELAKRAWIALHPEDYQRLLGSTSDTEATPMKP